MHVLLPLDANAIESSPESLIHRILKILEFYQGPFWSK